MRKPALLAGALTALVLGGGGALAMPSLAMAAAPPPALSTLPPRLLEADQPGAPAALDAATDAATVACAPAVADTELTAILEAGQAVATRAGRSGVGGRQLDALRLAAVGPVPDAQAGAAGAARLYSPGRGDDRLELAVPGLSVVIPPPGGSRPQHALGAMTPGPVAHLSAPTAAAADFTAAGTARPGTAAFSGRLRGC